MDTLDNLKQQWQQMEVRIDQLADANRRLSEQLAKEKTKTIQTQLTDRISHLSWCGLILVGLAPIMYYELALPLWVCVLYALFGLAETIIQQNFASYIRDESLIEMPVAQAVCRAAKIKIRMQRSAAVGYVFAIMLIAAIAFSYPNIADRNAAFIGGAIGLALGSIFGLRRLRNNLRIANRLNNYEKEV